MTRIAFQYRQRRSNELLVAHVGDVVTLAENAEYLIEFPVPPSSSELGAMLEIGYDPISEKMGLLSFRNFVGTTHLAGVCVKVVSTKLGENGASALLEQVSQLSSSLVFGWRSPLGFSATASDASISPIPFHQLQYLREIILRRPSGERLQDYFDVVERNPTRRFMQERPVVPIERARNFDARSVIDVFSHAHWLTGVQEQHSVYGSPLATALRIGEPPSDYFPTRASVSARRLTFDTPENRFIKHFLAECLSIVYRLLDQPNLHVNLRADCREIASILEGASRAAFLKEVAVLSSFASPGQALTKAEGYKELLSLWADLGSHQSLPATEHEANLLLQGKDIALLYEYWVFLQVLQAVSAVSGLACEPVRVSRSDLGDSLGRGMMVQLSPDISVSFNPSYVRSAGTAYSTPLRPDVVVSLGENRFAFDAKYRLHWLNPLDDSGDDEATFVRADIYKMHTYRDAITNMQAAFAVYPGTEFVFFERNRGRRNAPSEIATFDGVGAIPARPEDAIPTVMNEVIKALFLKCGLLS